MDVLGDILHMKSKHKLEICDVEAALNNFNLGFALECPNLLDEKILGVDF